METFIDSLMGSVACGDRINPLALLEGVLDTETTAGLRSEERTVQKLKRSAFWLKVKSCFTFTLMIHYRAR